MEYNKKTISYIISGEKYALSVLHLKYCLLCDWSYKSFVFEVHDRNRLVPNKKQ